MFSVGRLLASLFAVILMNRFGRANLIKLNFLIASAGFLAIGVTSFVHNQMAFCFLNAIYRFLLGVFMGLGVISVLALALSNFPNETPRLAMAQSIGYGIGSSFFPATGALFYHFFGFQGPAYFLAFVFMCTSVVFIVFLPNEEQIIDKLNLIGHYESAYSTESLPGDEVSLLSMLSNKEYVFALISMLLVQIKYTYTDPTLAPYYKDEF